LTSLGFASLRAIASRSLADALDSQVASEVTLGFASLRAIASRSLADAPDAPIASEVAARFASSGRYPRSSDC
jgi:hypothetical protein